VVNGLSVISYVLARTIEAIQAEEPVDLLLFGKQAIDGDTAQVGPGVATRLNVSLISYAIYVEHVDIEGRTAIVHRKTDRGVEVVEAKLPALLTVEKEIAPVKRAPLPSMIKAARYQPELWSATEPVAFDPTKIGIKGSPTIVGKAYAAPPREAGEMLAVAERGLADTVNYTMQQISRAGVVAFVQEVSQNGGLK